MQTQYSHNCLISCCQFVTERDIKRNIDSIFICHLHQFSFRQRPKLRRGVQEIKSWIVQALSLAENLFTLNYLILAFNFETFVANLFSKNKQAKRDYRTARSWSTRHCNKQDSAKTEVSSSMSFPSNILLYETDSEFHERLAAHNLLSPDKIHINFENYSK